MDNTSAETSRPNEGLRGKALRAEIIDRASWIRTVGIWCVVNAMLVTIGLNLRFVFALSLTDLMSYGAASMGGFTPRLGAILFAALACAGAYFFATFAEKGYTWAFKAAGAIYALDLVLWCLIGNWIEVAAHVFVLYQFYAGFEACKKEKLLKIKG